MRRKRFIIAGAGLLGVAAVAATILGTAGAGAAGSPSASPVTSTMTIDMPGQVFAPPPDGVTPAMTFQQVMAANHVNPLPTISVVQLGLFSNPAGSYYQGEDVGDDSIHDGTVYTTYQELAYGVSTQACTPGPGQTAEQCTEWQFYDANTGAFIAGMEPAPGMTGSSDSASPSPSASGSASGG